MDTGKQGTVILVEDEKKISDIVVLYLEREGFAVKVAETGQKALSLLKGEGDLVILDLMLPDISERRSAR